MTANDTDPDFDRLSVALETSAHEGVVTCGLTTCSYSAPQGFFGEDSFTYRVSDGNGGSDVATVHVAMLQNRPPVAVDDPAHVSTRNSVVISPIQNDSDPDHDPVYLDDWTQASQGTVVCEDACRYTPTDGASGTDSFTYTISDGRGGHATATVTIAITENGPPTALDDKADTVDTRTANLLVLGNDSDPDQDELRNRQPHRRHLRHGHLYRFRLLLHPECWLRGSVPGRRHVHIPHDRRQDRLRRGVG